MRVAASKLSLIGIVVGGMMVLSSFAKTPLSGWRPVPLSPEAIATK
jgi:hypothetical protein